jgi:hypothetical protein
VTGAVLLVRYSSASKRSEAAGSRLFELDRYRTTDAVSGGVGAEADDLGSRDRPVAAATGGGAIRSAGRTG